MLRPDQSGPIIAAPRAAADLRGICLVVQEFAVPATLPPEVLALVTGLPSYGMVARADDRRYRHRIPLSVRALLWRLGNNTQVSGPGMEVTIRDISGDGISFQALIAPALGEGVVVEVGRAGGPVLKLRYQVVRTQPLAGDQHLVGGLFEDMYADAAPPAAPRRSFWSRLLPSLR
jgi:hypothetical protein